jgi:poly-gamma-glutamate synthesis protein (capsule biosynthesis protein)
MQEIYRFFVDAGADAVVNHHQHCYSGFEFYEGRPIVYGLGNFCFDWQNRFEGSWTEGYLLQLTFEENDISSKLIPYTQCQKECCVKLLNEDKKKKFEERINQLNHIIADKRLLMTAYNEFVIKNEVEYKFLMTPYSGRLLKSLFVRGILPDMVNIRKALVLYNVLNCESHYERFLQTVRNKVIK